MYSKRLKERLKANALSLCEKKSCTGIQKKTAFLFNDISMNFHPKTFSNIKKNTEFKIRLAKPHPNVSNFKEMQSSNSSDALLMNFFAHPKIQTWKKLLKLLTIKQSDQIEFGWNPDFENEKKYKTEIDMKIGNSIFEAKLTESDFTKKEINTVLNYPKINTIININSLTKNNVVYNYQLIRNLLTAEKYDFRFNLLIDETRTDLIREFYKVKEAIKIEEISKKFNFITWQEIANNVGLDLKKYMIKKYF